MKASKEENTHRPQSTEKKERKNINCEGKGWNLEEKKNNIYSFI